MTGEIIDFQINQAFLLGSAVLMSIPTIMIFLSLTLSPKVNRYANMILGVAHIGLAITTMLTSYLPRDVKGGISQSDHLRSGFAGRCDRRSLHPLLSGARDVFWGCSGNAVVTQSRTLSNSGCSSERTCRSRRKSLNHRRSGGFFLFLAACA